MIARWIALTFLLTVGQITPIAADSPPTDPPLIPGTFWLYRYTLIDESGTPRIGTQKRLYDRSTYRGHTYYYVEVTDTLMPEGMVRAYFVWSNGHYHQTALEMHDAQNLVVEALFDKNVALDVPGSASGQARLIANGDDLGDVPWSIAVSILGTVNITVPAGTFQARRSEQKFLLGNLRLAQTDDSVGFVSVRTETTQGTASGTVHTVSELVSGPVPRR